MGGIYHDGDYYAGSDTNDRASKSIITNDTAYNPSKSYVSGDWFIDGDVLYEVKIACQGITPPNATYYDPITLHELKNRIDALKSDLNIKSLTYTPQSGYSFQTISVKRSGKMVQFYGYGTFAISSANTWVYIGQIRGITTPIDRYIAAYSASGEPYDGVGRVGTSGDVYIMTKTAKTNANIVLADVIMVN